MIRQKNNVRLWLRISIVAGLAMLLGSCQSNPYQWGDSTRDQLNRELDEARASGSKDAGDVPADVSQALLPPLEISLPEGGMAPLEGRFDLTVNRARARNVFMGLVEGTPYDMVVHPKVKGAITLNLKDVTVPEAIKAIRDVYGYDYTREGNRFFVYGRGMQTRVFTVNYLNLIRTGNSDTRVHSGGLAGTSSSGGSSAGGGGATSAFSSISMATETKADFWQQLELTLKAIVGNHGGRKVVINSQTGLVVVRAMPAQLRIVEQYLSKTHRIVNRQVVLEAKILDVELNDGFQSGINWAALGRTNTTDFTIGQVGGGTAINSGVSEIASNSGVLNPTTGIFSPISGTNASAFGGVFTLAAKSSDFSAFIELLKTQGEVQVLSSPRVSTVNNQKAVIKIGVDEFFVTGVSTITSTTTGGATTQSTPTVTLTSFFSGIVLDVMPQIDELGNIILHIHPSVNTIEEKTKSFQVSDAAFSLPLARSTVQESDSIVRSKNGQIIVIGGLMKEATTENNASVPLLGDIPILGHLFKHKKVTRIKKELVILLKPTVINVSSDWGEVVGESQQRMKEIRMGL
jgi:MSHA biogenesis protein MshL